MREQPLKHGSRTRIKIRGLTRPEDIQAVNQAKPDFAGFIVEFPKSRRNVTVEQLKAFREELDDSILPVGVFVNAPVELPAQLLNEGTIALAQLHGQEDENYIRQLKTMTDQLLIKAFSIKRSRYKENDPFGSRLYSAGSGRRRNRRNFQKKYIPETLMPAVLEVEEAYNKYSKDPEFNRELDDLLKEYAGRPSRFTMRQKNDRGPRRSQDLSET